MKAFLIDPNLFTITPVEWDERLLSIYQYLECGLVDVVTTPEGLSLYVDDEGLYTDNNFFRFKGCQPIRGNGLLLGPVDDEGDTTECPLTLDEVWDRVSFPVMIKVL